MRTCHKRDWDITESLKDGRVTVTARFISSLRLGGTAVDPDVTKNFSIQDVETLDFVPQQNYVDDTINKRSVRDYLEGCQYQLPVYMVTGLKIGRGLSRSLPVAPGVENSSTQPVPEQHASVESPPDFVIGYRLVKIAARESTNQGERSGITVLGRMLGDNDGRDTDFGSLRVTLTANIDGGREVEAHQIIGVKSSIAVDEDGDKECNCVVVTQLLE